MHKRVVIKDIEEFDKVCTQFFFKKGSKDTLIFAKKECVFEFNYEKSESKTIFFFKE